MATYPIVARGPRVYLRRLDLNEIDDTFMSWFSNEELMRYYTNSKKKITKDAIIEHILNGESFGTDFTYGIYDIATDKCIGTIKIGPINITHKISDLVALIGNTNYHGKGFASEAIALGNTVAFAEHDIRKLFGGMYETNIPSIKAYTKAGWIIEGRLRGHYIENGIPIDRILVGCFNPKYFGDFQ